MRLVHDLAAMGFLPDAVVTGFAAVQRLLDALKRQFHDGNGDPNGKVAARRGAQFFRRDGGAATTLYVKEADAVAGDPTQGWAAK